MIAHSSNFYSKIWVGFYLNTGKMLFLRGFILKPTERTFLKTALLKTALAIFKTALLLRHLHVFMRQALRILNIFNTLNLKNFFWKERTAFYLKVLRFETPHFDIKPPFENLTLRQNWPITNNGISPITALFFFKILFQIKNLL